MTAPSGFPRRNGLTTTKPLQRRTALRARSPKRARQERAYRQIAAQFLEQHPVCQRCQQARSTDPHHMAGRVGAALLDTSRWKALCRTCHRRVTEHPAEAIADGFSLPRLSLVAVVLPFGRPGDETGGEAA